jgi:PAS domain S-box-containing protein
MTTPTPTESGAYDLPAAALLEAMPDAIVVVDTAGNIVAVNAQTEHLFGTNRDQLVGQPVEVLIPERFRAAHVGHRADYADDPHTRPMGVGLTLWGRRQDGSEFPIEVSLSPLHTPQGLLITSVVRDVTERARAEAALQASERRFRALFDQAFQFVGLLTPDGVVLEANQTALDFVGVPLGEVQGRPFWETPWWTSAEEQARLRAAVRVASRGEMVRFETSHRRPSGQAITVDFSLKPVIDDARQVIQLIAEGRDISDRKEAEQALHEALAREQAARERADQLQLVSDSALSHLSLDALLAELLNRLITVLAIDTGAIFLLDPEQAVLHPAAAAGLERDANDQVAIPVGQFFSGQVAEQRRLLMVEDLAPEELGSIAARSASVRSALGAPLLVGERLIGVLRVGTRALRRFSDTDADLVQLAADRMALAIDHALLYQQAQSAVQARETFLSIASHELKTPLTTVKGWVNLMATALRETDEIDPVSIGEFADELQNQVDRLERLITDLLDVSRIQQGRLELQPEPVNLVRLLQAVLRRFEHAPERTPAHEVVLEVPATVTGVWDPDRLEQVVTNLMSNAFKYSPDGGVVAVRLRQDAESVTLAVADDGIGITPEAHARLFQPFERSAAARRSASGTGLGLFITKEIVEQHGGEIEVESVEGAGTTVTVRLPRMTRVEGGVGTSG